MLEGGGRAISLDDRRALHADRQDMLGAVERTPAQWADAVGRARGLEGLPSAEGLTGLVVCGMGGSGIVGDVVQAVATDRAPVAVSVVKGYALPAFVGPATLVMCVSYSGDTEETLVCFDAALARGARCVAVTTGGELERRAGQAGVPVASPEPGLQPRAALASLVAPALVILERLELLPGVAPDMVEAEALLNARAAEWGRDVPAGRNAAKGLAERLNGFLPLVWGQEGALAAAAVRWRCQFNENAKVPAFSSVLPELDHNEVVGYEPGHPVLDRVALVVLRTRSDDPRIARRVEATLDLVGKRVGRVEVVGALGESPLARFASAALLGDFASVYLALLRGVDPTPVEVITRLKRALE